jgi:hypothetical protein
LALNAKNIKEEVNMKNLQSVYENYMDAAGWGDKGTLHSYIEIYEEHMNKKQDIDILEIGVQKGHSIRMWQDYFINSNVYGIDITLDNVIYDGLNNVYVCDATSESQINEIFLDKKFDYVVDDGSHLIEHQIKSLEILWEKIKPGGKYFIEDVSGDQAINSITSYLESNNMKYTVIDNRLVKNRYDDIIILIEKSV